MPVAPALSNGHQDAQSAKHDGSSYKKRRTDNNFQTSPSLPHSPPQKTSCLFETNTASKAFCNAITSSTTSKSAQIQTNSVPVSCREVWTNTSKFCPPQPKNGFSETIVIRNPFDDSVPCSTTHKPPPRDKSKLPLLYANNASPALSHFNPVQPVTGFSKTVVARNSFDDSVQSSTACTLQHWNMQNSAPLHENKVLLPVQNMMFNFQKSNAQLIFPCGICHKKIQYNEETIICGGGCNFFYHRICAAKTECASPVLIDKKHSVWVCHICLSFKQFSSQFRS